MFKPLIGLFGIALVVLAALLSATTSTNVDNHPAPPHPPAMLTTTVVVKAPLLIKSDETIAARSVRQDVANLLATKPIPGNLTKRDRTTMIVIHHSATPTGNAEAFRKYHVEHNGWADIGYHIVITRDGRCEAGRHLDAVGAHAGSKDPAKRNRISIGICLVGENDFTPAQTTALTELLATLCHKYDIAPNAMTIQGHHEQCPGSGLNLESIISTP
jgi:N-acetyl-anhydromuramyl-L-alanine amidase AmpD